MLGMLLATPSCVSERERSNPECPIPIPRIVIATGERSAWVIPSVEIQAGAEAFGEARVDRNDAEASDRLEERAEARLRAVGEEITHSGEREPGG